MSVDNYQFIREVREFDTDSCIAHLGWIGSQMNRFKIYSRENSPYFYLHDEESGKLFEFAASRPETLRSIDEYHKVVLAYKHSDLD